MPFGDFVFSIVWPPQKMKGGKMAILLLWELADRSTFGRRALLQPQASYKEATAVFIWVQITSMLSTKVSPHICRPNALITRTACTGKRAGT